MFSSGFKSYLFHASIVQSHVYLAGIFLLVPMQFIPVMIRDWLVLGSSVSGVF